MNFEFNLHYNTTGPKFKLFTLIILFNFYNTCTYIGVKPLIHQSELRTYYKSSPFSRKKFLSLWSIMKTTEWNGLIKIDN